jgi:hypothetical protein
MNRIVNRINTITTKERDLYKEDNLSPDDTSFDPMKQSTENPSTNDFNKGYALDPYAMRYWANLDNGMKKIAWKEVDPLGFSPEYLADKILKLWNQIDGTLQNTFEAFTLRYDNKLKQEIAKIINSRGYEVYPILLIDAPIYAGKNNVYTKNMIKLCSKLVPTIGIKAFINDLGYLNRKVIKANKMKVTADEKVDAILDYYIRLFPEDYSLNLVKKINVSPMKKTDFDEFKDLQIQDDSLDMMELIDSESSDDTSISLKDGGFGGYDFVSDMRFDTTAPNMYEVTSKKKLKKQADDDEDTEDDEEVEDEEDTSDEEDTEKDNDDENDEDSADDDADEDEESDDSEEDEEETAPPPPPKPKKPAKSEEDEDEEEEKPLTIPTDLVFDVLSDASNNVNSLLKLNLRRSPVPVSTYIREDISGIADTESYESKTVILDKVNEVWEIFQMFLKNKTTVYIVISADCHTKDDKYFDWDNIEYRGFYSTKQEAVNEIKGYL